MADDKLSSPIDKAIVAYIIWVIVTYVLGLVFLNMYSSYNSPVLFWITAIVMIPTCIYAVIKLKSPEDKRASFQFIGSILLLGALLIYTSYYTLLKTDLLLSALARPSQEQQITIKKLEKDYVRRIGWDHTNVYTVCQGHDIKLEASRTAYFLLQNKKTLLVTIGRSYTGNYFVTDVHLPSSERWAARGAYLNYGVSEIWWIVALIVLVLLVIWLKRKLFPSLVFRDVGIRKLALYIALAIVILLVLVYAVLLICLKIHQASG